MTLLGQYCSIGVLTDRRIVKPDKNTCLNCGKEISLRAKYCSDKCTKAYKRNSDELGQKEPIKSDKTNSDTPNSELGQQVGHGPEQDDFRASLTKTDRTFYDRAMRDFGEPYYRFGGELRKLVCSRCGAKYSTTLSLLKYCSYQHYADSIAGKK